MLTRLSSQLLRECSVYVVATFKVVPIKSNKKTNPIQKNKTSIHNSWSSQSGDSWMYPGPTYPYGKSLYKPYITWVFKGYNPQESPENTINTMGTLLGVHPIVP